MSKALSTWLGLSLCTLGYLGTTNDSVLAQVTSDGTVNTQVNDNGSTAEITGGETRGDNLFHSFQDFSVKTGNEAFFNNADSIANIFSRVTGGNVSDIDGAIRANGSANLFLINPAGIIFGENASLNIGGSFYGSSASSILFEDGEFNATDLENPPVLTVNAPIGLGFRDNPAPIENNSKADAGLDPAGVDGYFGLRVPNGKSFALAGGDIKVDSGGIITFGGQIELAAVGGEGTLGLTSNGNNFSFSFPDNLSRANVSLTNTAGFLVAGGGGGDIIINAKDIVLDKNSSLIAGIWSNLGSTDSQAGDININATENVIVDGPGIELLPAINNSVFDNAIGNAGKINISARNISLNNGGQIQGSIVGQGEGSDITLNARENVSINGSNDSLNSSINSFVSGKGNSGTTNVAAQNLTLSNGGSISSSVSGVGDSGDININVKDSLTVDGETVLANDSSFPLPSSIKSNLLSDAQGNSGDIRINTSKLALTNGGSIDTSTFGMGNAGNIDINAIESISIDGMGTMEGAYSSISSSNLLSDAQGNGGNIEITTNKLALANGGQIDVGTFGIGNAGNIDINAIESISIDGMGTMEGAYSSISSSVKVDANQVGAKGKGGNIQISTGDFTISNKAGIDADTFGRGDGGEIEITAENLSITKGGGVDALTFGLDPDNIAEGNAGDITINVADTLSIDGTSTVEIQGQVEETPAGIFASNSGNSIGNAGNINVTANKLSLTNGSQIASATKGRGSAGNITINAEDSILLDKENEAEVATLISTDVAESGVGNGGQINLNTNNLSIFNGAAIQNATAGKGNAGSTTINAQDSIILSGEYKEGVPSRVISSVQKTAIGNGGTINLTTNNLDILDSALITVGSLGEGNSGNLFIQANSLNLDGSNINAKTDFGTGGNIQLQIVDSVVLDNNSTISAKAANNANGGNLTIDSNFIVAFPTQNNDILANAEQGAGGNITINAESVFGIEERPLNNSTNDINASSEFDLDGSVNINTSDINPVQGATELPSNVVEARQTADETCSANREGKASNGLAIAGRGGVHPAPDAPLNSENISNENPAQATISQPLETSQGKIQPAMGIKVTESGRIVLTAYPTNNAGQRITEIKANCN